jgi:hypothetical protein
MEEIIANGVKIGLIPDTVGAVEDETVERRKVMLPSGAEASVRKGVGRDLIRVQKTLDPKDPNSEDMFVFAIVAELVRIDGKRVTKEHLLDMPLGDVITLQKEVVGDNFLSLTRGTSLP